MLAQLTITSYHSSTYLILYQTKRSKSQKYRTLIAQTYSLKNLEALIKSRNLFSYNLMILVGYALTPLK